MQAALVGLSWMFTGGCETGPDQIMQRERPHIAAHRGASTEAPENTLVAFRMAWQEGADLIEGDFRMTRDGEIVCMHDETLARTTGDARRVVDVTVEEIRQLEAGAWKGERFAGEPVPLLREVMETIPDGKGILIEVKTGPEIVPALVAEIEASGLDEDQVTVIAFDWDVVRALKQARPSTRALLLSSFKEDAGAWSPSVEDLERSARRLGAEGIDVKANPAVLTREFVEHCTAAGLEVHVWTVDSPALADTMAGIGVASITTNRPGKLRAELEAGDS